MGRHPYSTKIEADYLKKLDIRELKRDGFLDFWKESGVIRWVDGAGNESSIGIIPVVGDEGGLIRLRYAQVSNGKEKKFDYNIQLTTTYCNFGGQRLWFICPLVKNGESCGRRVGVLYKGGDYFGCRHCQNLTYDSNKSGYSITSIPEIARLEKEIKRKYYNGNMTRKFKSLIKKKRRTLFALSRFRNFDFKK